MILNWLNGEINLETNIQVRKKKIIGFRIKEEEEGEASEEDFKEDELL